MRRAPVLWIVAGGVALGLFLGLRGQNTRSTMPVVNPLETEPTDTPASPLTVQTPEVPPHNERVNTRAPEGEEAPVPVTLEGLAQLALHHEEAMAGCFEDAYRSQRLRKGRVHMRIQAARNLDGQTRVHVTVPDTDEHLYDAEACLNRILGSATLGSLEEDQETGVMWGLTLPIDQWAENP